MSNSREIKSTDRTPEEMRGNGIQQWSQNMNTKENGDQTLEKSAEIREAEGMKNINHDRSQLDESLMDAIRKSKRNS